jgi:hypothetical protein
VERRQPDMLAWWYGHVSGAMHYAGQLLPRYLVLHPLDLLSYEVTRSAGDAIGAGTGVAFRRGTSTESDHLVDVTVTVEEVSDQRAVISRTIFGGRMVRLDNVFEPAADGVLSVSRMTG